MAISNKIKLTECPRDAMQGIHQFIPTDLKAAYINLLLQVGFNIIDFGSFVSPTAIPQLKDTAAVLQQLELSSSRSKLLAIVANYRGAEEATKYPEITYLGYPFSISDTFQRRNTNSNLTDAFNTVKGIFELCEKTAKQLRIYLSMGFGNPYGDEWSIDIVQEWVDLLFHAGITEIYLADTIGIATVDQITEIMQNLRAPKGIKFGMHLHSTPSTSYSKIEAAYKGGCHLFDSALKGYGGCPMAKDELIGNIATENLIGYLQSQGEHLELNYDKWQEVMDFSSKIFEEYH